MAAADGDFCKQEREEIITILARSPAKFDSQAVRRVIQVWSEKVRAGGVIKMIAQSIVDVRNLDNSSNIVNHFKKDLIQVAKADGNASYNEGVIYKAIVHELDSQSG